MPEDVEPKEPDYLDDPRSGRFIIPEGIRPVLKEFRIEVWWLSAILVLLWSQLALSSIAVLQFVHQW